MRKSKEAEIVRFYEADAEAYDADRFLTIQGAYVDRIQKEIVLNMLGSWSNKKILDLGCGTGRFSIEIAKRGARVTAFDPSKSMLEQARRKIKNSEINLIRGDGCKLPFQDNTFDGCVCVNVINHVEDYYQLMREIGRVVQEEGFIIINFSNFFSFYLPIALYVNITKRSVQKDVYSKWFTTTEIKNCLATAGFKIHDVKGHLLFPKRAAPKFLIDLLKNLDAKFRSSQLKYLTGSLFIKGIKKRCEHLTKTNDGGDT
ncbi:MAG: class I SAM-dependent methyltransferase [Candidatus Jordarchaeaceae archaeon]